jgi:replicative DNA helicase
MSENKIPHDLVAEESLLGAMFLSVGAIIQAADTVAAEDFYRPMHADIFGAICNLFSRGTKVDQVTVASELNNSNLVSILVGMSLNCPSASNAVEYGMIIAKHASARRLMVDLQKAQQEIAGGGNPYEVAQTVGNAVASVGAIRSVAPESMTMTELDENADALAPIVIPGMMTRESRTIVVAEEGAGKSMILRTIAMAASQGVHPFSHRDIPPVRALVIDLENPTQAITQTGVPFMKMLRDRVGENYDETRLKFFRRPGGIEIRKLSDFAEIQREIAFHRPELVCIGPIYKMYRRGANETYEDSADGAMAVLDKLRTTYDFALVMEHHAAKGAKGERELTPMGSQRWMAWPETGISLYKDDVDKTMLHVKRFRGDRLQGVDWPDRILRDRQFLFDGVWD